ncbi:MAG: thioredoxin family protein [Acidimicrobiales bacterium]
MTSLLTTFEQPTLVEVMAPHCVECRAMQPDLDAVANEFDDRVDLVVLDATVRTEEAADLRVLGTPTLIAVKSGVEVARFTGRRTKTELRELFAAVAEGDVASVSKRSNSDRTVWTVAGALLAVVGAVTGPSWLLLAIGLGLVGYANVPRS